MTKEQAKMEYKKIMEDVAKKYDEIEKEAKENGTWFYGGLDCNNHLYKKVDDEAREKIKLLASMIDE